MGIKARLKKEKKRTTRVLREVIGTDLLTWKDKLIQGQVSGLYSLTNEQAYFKCPGDPASLSLPEFERRLRAIDNLFCIVPCETKTEEHQLQGHSIYYEVPAFGGFIKVCNVGKNADYNIPANSVGKVVLYKGETYKAGAGLDEEPLLYRGWVAAMECCKAAYKKWELEGISPAMVLNPKEVLNMRQAATLVGYREEIQAAKKAHETMLEADNALIMTLAESGVTLEEPAEEEVITSAPTVAAEEIKKAVVTEF